MANNGKSKATAKHINGAVETSNSEEVGNMPAFSPDVVNEMKGETEDNSDEGGKRAKRGSGETVMIKVSRKVYTVLRIIRDKRSVEFSDVIEAAVDQIAAANSIPVDVLKFFLDSEEAKS